MRRIMALLLLAALPALAQTNEAPPASAADYFNIGSATFIREDPQTALAIVNEGLAFHPGDEPLTRLKQLLEQQQQQQDQNQQQENEDSESQDQPQDSDQQPPPEEQQENEQEQEQQDQNQPEPPQAQEPQEAEQPDAGEMTEEEANMILDSLRQLEQARREQMNRQMIRQQMRDMPPVEKDW